MSPWRPIGCDKIVVKVHSVLRVGVLGSIVPLVLEHQFVGGICHNIDISGVDFMDESHGAILDEVTEFLVEYAEYAAVCVS